MVELVSFLVPHGLQPPAPLNLHIVSGSSGAVVLRWSPVKVRGSGSLLGYQCTGGGSRTRFVAETTCSLPRSAVARHGGFVVLSVVAVDAAHRRSASALLDIKLS